MKTAKVAIGIESVGEPYFSVTGGGFSGTSMRWRVTDKGGYTVAISPSAQFCEDMQAAFEALVILDRADLLYHMTERAERGYLEPWQERLLNRLEEIIEQCAERYALAKRKETPDDGS